jgi:hypothetical protein
MAAPMAAIPDKDGEGVGVEEALLPPPPPQATKTETMADSKPILKKLLFITTPFKKNIWELVLLLIFLIRKQKYLQ